jgi:hypothetical protein
MGLIVGLWAFLGFVDWLITLPTLPALGVALVLSVVVYFVRV